VEATLIELLERLVSPGGALVITGPIGAGKTSAAGQLAACLRGRGWVVGGVVSPRVVEAGATLGYRVRDLLTGEEAPLCSLQPPGIKFRRFYFSPAGLELGRAALARAARQAQLAVVDEVGPWELAGGGFAPALPLLTKKRLPLVLTVRPHLVAEVLGWLGLPPDTPRVSPARILGLPWAKMPPTHKEGSR